MCPSDGICKHNSTFESFVTVRNLILHPSSSHFRLMTFTFFIYCIIFNDFLELNFPDELCSFLTFVNLAKPDSDWLQSHLDVYVSP